MELIPKLLLLIWTRKRLIFFSGLLVLVLCEAYLRVPWLIPRLEYRLDDVLVATLEPNQTGFMWMGDMSYKSPPIRINSDGNRGSETDWSQPVILAIGNSEAFGSGVKDSQVWTARLESNLRQIKGLNNIEVVNAAHPGYGPYQHAVMVERILKKRLPEMIIVRVDIADRYFRAILDDKRPELIKKAQFRLKVRKFSKGIPFLFNKIKTQIGSIRQAVRFRFRGNQAHASQYRINKTGKVYWEQNRIWWEKIAELSILRNIPLVFIIHDIYGTPSYQALCQAYEERFGQTDGVHLLRLDPEILGLRESDPEILRRKIHSKFTLKRDPHANPAQHQMIAQAIFKFINRSRYLLLSDEILHVDNES
jgi:hypothetical protein